MYAKIGTACISLTQNVQKSDQVLDKVRARRIIVRSFVRSFVRSRNSCPKHKIRKTIKQSRPHEPAAKKGFRASLVQNFFRSGTLQPLRFLAFTQFGVRFTRTNAQRQTCRDMQRETPRSRSLAFRRFHTLFPHIRAKSFGTNIFLLYRYAFCTGHKRRRANNPVGIHAVLKRTAQMAPLAWAPSLLRKLARHMTLSSQF